MLKTQHPPTKIDNRILAFCRQICPTSRPQYVPVRPAAGSKIRDCHRNVEKYVQRMGGEQVYGWEISILPGLFLEAQFHSIWLAPNGQLVDITQEDYGHTRILFLRDPHRSYSGSAYPNQRALLGPEALVERYLELSSMYHQIFQDLLAAGFQKGEPVFRSRLGEIRSELESLRRQAQSLL